MLASSHEFVGPAHQIEPVAVKEVREQVPGSLTRFDDPWGITWRLHNAISRFSLKKFWRYQSARFKACRHERPVFILGAPRSGTSMLFHVLSAHPELGSLGREGHDMWRKYHHPRRNGWRSDAIGSGQLQAGERAFINRYLYMNFDQARFVEKTPESCLRLPYLKELYPDATFIFVKRDPREVISSMLNGWRHPLGRFRSYFVPETLEIPDYTHPHQWCFALIENWRDFKTQPLEEIVAEQWQQMIQGALSGRHLINSAQWIELTLADFTADPVTETLTLLDKLDLPTAAAPLAVAEKNAVINPMGESAPGNWQANAPQLAKVLPRVEAVIEACGFNHADLLAEVQSVADATRRGVK